MYQFIINLFVGLTVLIMFGGAFWYCLLIHQKSIHPTLATWVVGFVAATLSYSMYWDAPHHSIEGNISNLMAMLTISTITILLVWTLWRNHLLGLEFTPWQKGCLAGAAMITWFWFQTNNAWVSFCLIQLLFVIAYIPMIEKLKSLGENTDSTLMWASVMAGSMLGMVPSALKGDELGILNAVRSILCSGFSFHMMWKLDCKTAAKQFGVDP